MKYIITIFVSMLLLLSCDKKDVQLGAETISFNGEGYVVSTLAEGCSIYSDNNEWTVTGVPVYFNGFKMLIGESSGEHPCQVISDAYGMVYVICGADANMPDGWQKLSGNEVTITNSADQSTLTVNVYYKIAYGGNAVEIPTDTGSLCPVIPIARIIN